MVYSGVARHRKLVVFKVIMIKMGVISDKITYFDNSDNDFCDNVITPCFELRPRAPNRKKGGSKGK